MKLTEDRREWQQRKKNGEIRTKIHSILYDTIKRNFGNIYIDFHYEENNSGGHPKRIGFYFSISVESEEDLQVGDKIPISKIDFENALTEIERLEKIVINMGGIIV